MFQKSECCKQLCFKAQHNQIQPFFGATLQTWIKPSTDSKVQVWPLESKWWKSYSPQITPRLTQTIGNMLDFHHHVEYSHVDSWPKIYFEIYIKIPKTQRGVIQVNLSSFYRSDGSFVLVVFKVWLLSSICYTFKSSIFSRLTIPVLCLL